MQKYFFPCLIFENHRIKAQLSHKKLPAAAFLQKISLRRRESRLAARASHSAVTVDFPETSLCGIPRTLRLAHALRVVVVEFY